MAVEKGEVGFCDLALREHLAKLAMGAVVFSNEDEAARLFVKAMDDARTEIAAGGGEFVEVEEERIDEGAAVAFVIAGTGSGVDHHAGWLVDDGEIFVFVEDVERDVFGCGMERRRLRRAFDLNGLAAVELLFGLGGVTINADLASFDQELDSGSGDIREGLGQVLIEAKIGCGWVGDEGARAGGAGYVGVFFELVEVDYGDWWWESLLNSSGGAVFGFYGAASLALGEHVLRRHG
jgi:hypothetical protein